MKERVANNFKNMNIRRLKFILLFAFCIIDAFYVYYTKICTSGQGSLVNYQKLFLIVGAVLAVMEIISYAFKNKLYSAKWFNKTVLAFLLVFGSVMALLIPLGNCPDESTHMNTAYYYSNKILGVKDSASGLTMRKCDTQEFKYNGVTYTDMIGYLSDFQEPAENTELIETSRYSMNVSKYFYTFIPQAIGISIGRLLNLNTILTFMLGRLFNLLAYALLAVLALKIMPSYKSVLMFIAFLPMALQQAISLSYDSVVNGLGLCVMAITFRLFESTDISKKEKIGYAVLCVLLFFSKQFAYCAVAALPVLYYGFDRFRRKHPINREKFKKVLLWLLPVCLMLYVILCLTFGKTLAISSPLYFMLHPFTFINKINLSLIQWSDYYFRTLFTGGFGWDELQAPAWINMAFFALFIFVTFGGTWNQSKRKGKRVAIFGICLFTLIALSYRFQQDTPLEWGYIWGIQGRYFIPLMGILMYAISKKGRFADSESVSLLNVQHFLCYITFFELFAQRTMM